MTCTDEGILLEAFPTGWHVVGFEGTPERLSIPETHDGAPVNFLGSHAFEGCTSLKSIHIPDTVAYLGKFAFQGCTSLADVRLPGTAGTLSLGLFWGCSALRRVHVPEGVRTVGDGAFRNCDALEALELPDSLEEIGDSACRCCASLGCVVVPPHVERVGRSAFRDCPALSRVELSCSVCSVGPRTFEGCPRLASIRIYGPDPTQTATAFLNTQTMYLVADYLVELGLIEYNEAKTLLTKQDDRLKLLGARVLCATPRRLWEVMRKPELVRVLAQAGRVHELRALEGQAGFFTAESLGRAIAWASEAGHVEAAAYLVDAKSRLYPEDGGGSALML